MTDSLLIAHLSDLHLGPIEGFHPRYWNAKRGLGYVNWRRGRRSHHLRSVADAIAADALAQKPDHFAVTGDLANLGLPGEYEVAFAWLSALGGPEQVSVVPGNHDIYTSRLHGASCLERWAPFMRSCDGASGPVTFPYVRKVGPVALIGLCSAVPTPVFVASGRLGEKQIAALGGVLERLGREGLIRVIMIHHPPLSGQAPPRRGLEDAVALEKVLDAHGAELILHGHNHTDSVVWREERDIALPVVGIASASAARTHKREPLARYNLLRITREGRAVKILRTQRGLAVPDGEIVELSHQELARPSLSGAL
jgi:3',5'-cyclic AMP phosphodiesterase CpdA